MIYYLAAPLLIISALPQTIRLLKTKSSEDISITMYLMTLAGVLLIFIRAVEIRDTAIILGNGGSLIFIILNTFLVIRYRKNIRFFKNKQKAS